MPFFLTWTVSASTATYSSIPYSQTSAATNFITPIRVVIPIPPWQIPGPTSDEPALFLMAQRAQERAIRRREREMDGHLAEVKERAQQLLLRHLTEEQRESFLAYKFFVVKGRSGERYRIEDRGHMVANIAVLTRHVGLEAVKHRLCGHCDRSIPLADQLLAQKLMIEGAEDEFLRIANRHAA